MNHSTPEDPISTEIAALQKPLKGRRLLSWLFFVSFMAIFLVAPIAASVWPSAFGVQEASNYLKNSSASKERSSGGFRRVSVDSATGKETPVLPTAMALDTSWNPGRVASSHQPWANDCKVCHSAPFSRVQDKDCVACHQNMGEHVNSKVVKLDSLHETRCATCHRDHQGEFGLVQQNKHYTGENCAACHADIKTSFPNTKTENVKDFANGHPEFRVQLANGRDSFTRMRLSAKSKLAENTNLKFPHDVHLDQAGVRSPKGTVRMECNDCHTPNADGVGFKPVTMKDNCQSCHALKFEPAVSNREVPHGSVEQVLSTLREFYSYVGSDRLALDQRPENGPIYYLRPGKQQVVASYVSAPGDARSRAIASATELFEKTSCVVCHDVSRSNEPGKAGTPGQDMPQWKIAPVTAQHTWMPKAHFSHAKHQAAKCTDCHDAAKSKEATDVLMPVISQCTDCHAGKEPVVNKITSDCGLCHGFHMPSGSGAAHPGKSQITSKTIKP